MKPFFFILILLFSGALFAQNEDDAIHKQMESIEEEMQEFFKDLGSDTRFFMDTLMIEDFSQLDPNQLFKSFESEGFEDLFQLMEQQLQQLSDEDIQSMQQHMQHLMDSFGGLGWQQQPAIPAPDQLEDNNTPQKTPPIKKKKKRKMYSM